MKGLRLRHWQLYGTEGVLARGSLEGPSLCPVSLQALWDISHKLPDVLDAALSVKLNENNQMSHFR